MGTTKSSVYNDGVFISHEWLKKFSRYMYFLDFKHPFNRSTPKDKFQRGIKVFFLGLLKISGFKSDWKIEIPVLQLEKTRYLSLQKIF